jgi:hypothetical protein
MAPQRKNKRLNVPGSRTPATYDLKNQEHFNEFKREGFIPEKYNNYAELQDDFLSLVYEGVSDADAAEALGVDYRNVIGKGFLAAELSSKGVPRGISARTLREDIKPDERDYLIERFGKDWFDAYQRYRKLEWGDAKALKKDKELIEQFSGRPVEEFTSAKQEADVLRDRLAAAFGKGGRAGQVHRGHGVSAMEGASVGKANLMPESGPLNVGHGSNPRYDYNVMRNLNMSSNDLQNAYDDILQREGLTINPRRYPGNYVAADEALREIKQGTSMGNPQVTVPVEPTAVDPRSIEWRDRRMFELERQIAGEYEQSGMDPMEAAAKARQRLEEAALSQSTLFNTTQSRGGPVTVIKQATPMPKQIGTVVGEQQFDPFGRSKLDRSGAPKFETRPIYEPPSGRKFVPKGGILGKAGPAAAGLGIAAALLSDNPAEAIPVAAESLTPLGDIQGAPEPAITMVNVGGKLRPLNTDTNTLMDKPGYGLEQKGGQWREVKRGMGAATKQQQQAIQQTVQQVTNLMPKVNKVINPVGARITNEAQYFIVNPIRSAYDRIFGKRDI